MDHGAIRQIRFIRRIRIPVGFSPFVDRSRCERTLLQDLGGEGATNRIAVRNRQTRTSATATLQALTLLFGLEPKNAKPNGDSDLTDFTDFTDGPRSDPSNSLNPSDPYPSWFFALCRPV